VPSPRGYHREILNHHWTSKRVLFRGNKLDCTLALAHRLLRSSQSGVDQAQDTPWRAETRLGFDDFLLLHAGSGESSMRFLIIFRHASDKTFNERPGELDTPVIF